MALTLTPKAAAQVKALLQKQGRPGGLLRLKIVAGGCSGFSYEFELAEAAKPGDLVTETDGAKLAVDGKALVYVDGSVVDFVKTMTRQGFDVKNPKAASECGCGTSFSV